MQWSRTTLSGFGFASVLLVVLVIGVGSSHPGAAQDTRVDATATRAAEEAELTELRGQVAALSTEVARLAGPDQTGLAGRLGGDRAGFSDTYGEPVAFFGPDDVLYDVGDVGSLAVSFVDDRAKRLVVSAPRPPAKAMDEADDADWTVDEARRIAAGFAPADADLPDDGTPTDDGNLVISGTSPSLAAGGGELGAGDCPPPGETGAFTVRFTMPTRDTVSSIVLEAATTTDGFGPATSVPAASGRTTGGGGAVANSSLGGTVVVNGVRVVASQARIDAESPRPLTEGTQLVSVDLAIENMTNGPLGYQPADFVLVGQDGTELVAVCGGTEPSITAGELVAGETIEGWVSFIIPEGFDPERFVYLVGGTTSVRVGFVID